MSWLEGPPYRFRPVAEVLSPVLAKQPARVLVTQRRTHGGEPDAGEGRASG